MHTNNFIKNKGKIKQPVTIIQGITQGLICISLISCSKNSIKLGMDDQGRPSAYNTAQQPLQQGKQNLKEKAVAQKRCPICDQHAKKVCKRTFLINDNLILDNISMCASCADFTESIMGDLPWKTQKLIPIKSAASTSNADSNQRNNVKGKTSNRRTDPYNSFRFEAIKDTIRFEAIKDAIQYAIDKKSKEDKTVITYE